MTSTATFQHNIIIRLYIWVGRFRFSRRENQKTNETTQKHQKRMSSVGPAVALTIVFLPHVCGCEMWNGLECVLE